jgi:hypothetical protein
MTAADVRVMRSRVAAGDVVVRLRMPLLDEYLEFCVGGAGSNTLARHASAGIMSRCSSAVRQRVEAGGRREMYSTKVPQRTWI